MEWTGSGVRMRRLLLEALVRAQSRRVDRDASGLSLLAYALGAAVIIAPLVILLLPVAQDAVSEAEAGVDAALAAS